MQIPQTSVKFLPAGPRPRSATTLRAASPWVQQGLEVVALEYDDANRRKRVTLPNGIRIKST